MKDLKIYLIVGAVLLILYTLIEYNRPKPTNWSPTYASNEKIPFGTFILFDRVKDLFQRSTISTRRQPIYNVLVDSNYKRTAYVIICNSIQPSEQDYEQLTRYIKAGNDVFIAAENFGNLFEDKLRTSVNNPLIAGNKEYVTFVNPRMDNERQYYVDRGAINNNFDKLDTLNTTVLGIDNDGTANFIRYKMGKGSLYLTVNPKLFTNYSLLKPQGARYAAYALSYLNNPNKIIWDEYYTQGSAVQASPMRVFLTNDTLRWAYYTALISLLIFVVYSIKRTQRIIPVIEPLKNSTIDFVNVVGQVYYEQRDNRDIAHKKIQYFLALLRDEYQLKTNKLDMEFTTALAQKMGLTPLFARDLVNYIIYINNQQRVTDSELLELNKLIENFYTLSA
jgi:hypothetical protein